MHCEYCLGLHYLQSLSLSHLTRPNPQYCPSTVCLLTTVTLQSSSTRKIYQSCLSFITHNSPQCPLQYIYLSQSPSLYNILSSLCLSVTRSVNPHFRFLFLSSRSSHLLLLLSSSYQSSTPSLYHFITSQCHSLPFPPPQVLA